MKREWVGAVGEACQCRSAPMLYCRTGSKGQNLCKGDIPAITSYVSVAKKL